MSCDGVNSRWSNLGYLRLFRNSFQGTFPSLGMLTSLWYAGSWLIHLSSAP